MGYQRKVIHHIYIYQSIRVDYVITIEFGQWASRKSFTICKGWSNQERLNGKIQVVATYS